MQTQSHPNSTNAHIATISAAEAESMRDVFNASLQSIGRSDLRIVKRGTNGDKTYYTCKSGKKSYGDVRHADAADFNFYTVTRQGDMRLDLTADELKRLRASVNGRVQRRGFVGQAFNSEYTPFRTEF